MNYGRLTARIVDKLGMSKADIDRVLDELRSATHEELKSGEDIFLPGLGRFEAVDRSARKGRNPKTGEEIDIPAKRVPKFIPAKALKEAIAG